MNRVKLALLILLLVSVGVLTSGCMQISQEVKVNRDGTGIMMETIKLSPVVMEMIKGFTEGMMEVGGEKSDQKGISQENLFPEEQFKERAKQMGEGVEFLSREVKEFEEGMVGYVATYKIGNIAKFILNPREKKETMEKPGTNTPITFHFSRGTGSSHLIIKQNFARDEKETEEKTEEEPQEEKKPTQADKEKLAELMKMMGGMRMQIVIECGEEIEATNADWWDKNRIILVDFDMEQLFSHPDKLQMLNQMKKPQLKKTLRNSSRG